MPLIHLYSTEKNPPPNLLLGLRSCVMEALGLSENKVWLFWHSVEENNYLCNIWNEFNNPIVYVHCKSKYTKDELSSLIYQILNTLQKFYPNTPINNFFIGVFRFNEKHVFVNGELYH